MARLLYEKINFFGYCIHKNSSDQLHCIYSIGTLPSNARFFTSDAQSMYTNIDTKIGIQAFRDIFATFSEKIPDNLPQDLFLTILELVMRNNIFAFGDTTWIQLTGIAMGTSCACMYATLTYAYHEETMLLPTYKPYLLLYTRFIDDIFGIWVGSIEKFEEFKNSLNFCGLTWDTTSLSHTCNFLDLTLTIESTMSISTKTYQKLMNLYLYLPSTSSHPPGALKGLVTGNLLRYWKQNTHHHDFIYIVTLFIRRLMPRGNVLATLTPIFEEASSHIKSLNNKTVPFVTGVYFIVYNT